MELLREELVWRDRRLDRDSSRARELWRRLLAERAKHAGRPLEIAARRGVGVVEQPHDEADDDGVDPRLVGRAPHEHGEPEIDQPDAQAKGAQAEDSGESADPDEERAHRKMVRVDRRDDDDPDDVVNDDHRQHECAQPARDTRTDERQHPQCEGGVRRHRGAPAVRRGVAEVERQEDRDRHQHAADAAGERHDQTPALAQLANVELPPRLEANDEEEDHHQPVVDPAAQALADRARPEPDRQVRVPDPGVGRVIRVRPGERDDRRGEQDQRAAGLRAQEAKQRRRDVSRPGRSR